MVLQKKLNLLVPLQIKRIILQPTPLYGAVNQLLYHMSSFYFRVSVNQITDQGVRVLYEELSKFKIVSYLGYVQRMSSDAHYVKGVFQLSRGIM